MVDLVVPEGPEGPEPGEKVSVYEKDMAVVAPVKKGRPKKASDNDRLAKVLNLYFVEKLSMRKVADVLGMSHMTVYRMLSDPNLELLI